MQAGNSSISKRERRRAFGYAYGNGAIWSLGNGLASTSLIVYMVRELGAAGLGISIILAAPHLVGSLRLVAPALIGRAGSRKTLCVVTFAASAILLAAISQLAEPRQLASPSMSLSAIVVLWCIYHLLEYVGTVYLWAWLGDLAPRRIRGRFIGRRERWMLLARIVGMLAGGSFSAWWLDENVSRKADQWMAYALPACMGAGLMMMAILPLLRMPEAQERAPQPAVPSPLTDWWRPLTNRNMRWLLAFGAWFSLANGLTQSAQYLFPIAVFGLSLFARQTFEALMRGAQAASAPRVGRLVDVLGNRGVLIVSQLIVALAPLSLFIASRIASSDEPLVYDAQWWEESMQSTALWWLHGGIWIAGAWVCFIAYVGLNIGLPNLMLKLASPGERSSYIAWYFALTGVVYGLCTIAGGALYTMLEKSHFELSIGYRTLDYNELLFLAGFTLRATAVLWLLPIFETPRSTPPPLESAQA